MISFIQGKIVDTDKDRIVVENGGIGFEILMPDSMISALPARGSEVRIFTYMYVREDVLALYGFLSKDALDMFKLLITVSGIGPKGALGILSVLTVDALRLAIISDDAKTIAKAPGIGAKTASKLVLELKDKCHIEDIIYEDDASGAQLGTADSEARSDAIQALVALGYSASEATRAVREVATAADMTVEEILKQSLKRV